MSGGKHKFQYDNNVQKIASFSNCTESSVKYDTGLQIDCQKMQVLQRALINLLLWRISDRELDGLASTGKRQMLCDCNLDVVLKLSFKLVFASVEMQNIKCSHDNAHFVSIEIRILLSKRCIKEVATSPLIVNLLTVAINRSCKGRFV